MPYFEMLTPFIIPEVTFKVFGIVILCHCHWSPRLSIRD